MTSRRSSKPTTNNPPRQAFRAHAIRIGFACALLFLGCAAPAFSADDSFKLADLSGKEVQPLKLGAAKGAVFIFITSDCPIANSYAPEFARLAADYTPKGFAVYLVHVDPDLTADAARKHAAEYKLPATVLLDPEQRLVAATGATTTPQAVVLAPDGKKLYIGRIDDLWSAPGKRRGEPTTHDLRAALDAVLAGQPVLTAETVAVGCFIAPLKRR